MIEEPTMEDTCKTMSVPKAGAHYLGLGRDASYAAARLGDLPVIRVGRIIRVSVPAMDRLVDEARPRKAEAV
jgi:hypothetical protein